MFIKTVCVLHNFVRAGYEFRCDGYLSYNFNTKCHSNGDMQQLRSKFIFVFKLFYISAGQHLKLERF